MQSSPHNYTASSYRLSPISEEEAREIAEWRYDGEYAIYNSSEDQIEEAVRAYLNPDFAYHSVWHDDFGLCGFCCFGADARVPGGAYTEDAVDVGLGLRPDLIGQGLGLPILQAILQHASAGANDVVFRATVAASNGRSRRLFEKECFVQEQAFSSQNLKRSDPLEFLVMVRRPPR